MTCIFVQSQLSYKLGWQQTSFYIRKQTEYIGIMSSIFLILCSFVPLSIDGSNCETLEKREQRDRLNEMRGETNAILTT